jgi:hypothetical protein
MRKVGARLVDWLEPKERYNSLHLRTWAVEVIGRRENPDDPVVLKVEGSRGTNLVQSVKQTGLIAEPLTNEQRQEVQAAMRDYGPAGSGYWRRHLPEWTRRELLLARLSSQSAAAPSAVWSTAERSQIRSGWQSAVGRGGIAALTAGSGSLSERSPRKIQDHQTADSLPWSVPASDM